MSYFFESDLNVLKSHIADINASSAQELVQVLGLEAIPNSLENLEATFSHEQYPQYGYLRLWVLGEFARLKVDWACNLKGLRGNYELTEIPENIGHLTALQELNLNGNSLTGLPETIGELRNLLNLWLGNNYLETLPESIGKLENLERLSLYYNHLETLPESFGNLKNLIRLNLNEVNDENPITLPESFSQLSNLRVLEIAGNLDAVTPSIREGLKDCNIG